MKTIRKFTATIIFFFLAAGPAAAQLIDAKTASNFTNSVRPEAGFTDVSIGYVVAMLIRGFLGLIGITFIILIVLAGFRWMNSGGNEEAIKKAQETIKNSIIGLIIVLAAWAITYFIFRALPFSATGGGLQGGTSGG